jgi:hypothetical protein
MRALSQKKKFWQILGCIVVLVIVIVMIHAASVWTGDAFSTYVLHTQKGNGYMWWSGPGANFGELTIFGSVVAIWRHINCESPGCLRRGHYPTADKLHHLCRKHHPDLPNHRLSLEEIHERHHKAKVSGEGPRGSESSVAVPERAHPSGPA